MSNIVSSSDYSQERIPVNYFLFFFHGEVDKWRNLFLVLDNIAGNRKIRFYQVSNGASYQRGNLLVQTKFSQWGFQVICTILISDANGPQFLIFQMSEVMIDLGHRIKKNILEIMIEDQHLDPIFEKK